MRIYLIGFMGSGKTTIGKILSKKLGIDFIDTDRYISDSLNLSISEIFQTKGEKYFREQEKRALKKLSTKANIVISTGGGLPCFNDNIDLMNKTGITIYLKVGLDTLLSRIKHDKKRPLANQKSKKDLNDLLKNRRPIYEKSKFVVLGNRNEYLVAERIIKLIENH